MALRGSTDQLTRSNNKKPMGHDAQLTGTQNWREKCQSELSGEISGTQGAIFLVEICLGEIV